MPLKLIDNWRDWHRLGSVRLAAVVAAIAGALTAEPVILVGMIGFLPTGGLMQILAVLFVTVIVFAIPTATRLFRKTPPETCPPEEAMRTE